MIKKTFIAAVILGFWLAGLAPALRARIQTVEAGSPLVQGTLRVVN